MSTLDIQITNEAVVIRTGTDTVTVNLDRKQNYLVAVNPDSGGPTKVISRS